MSIPKPDRPWPAVSQALVERLEETYKDRAPSPEMTEREIWMAAGAALVVRKLRSLNAQQSLTVLSTTAR